MAAADDKRRPATAHATCEHRDWARPATRGSPCVVVLPEDFGVPFRKPRPAAPGKGGSEHDSSRTPKTRASRSTPKSPWIFAPPVVRGSRGVCSRRRQPLRGAGEPVLESGRVGCSAPWTVAFEHVEQTAWLRPPLASRARATADGGGPLVDQELRSAISTPAAGCGFGRRHLLGPGRASVRRLDSRRSGCDAGSA